LTHEGYRTQQHILVEFDNPGDFELYAPAVNALHATDAGAFVTAQFPGFTLPGLPPKGPGAIRSNFLYIPLTDYNGTELGTADCGGALGWGVLKKYRVVLDLSKGQMSLTPLASAQPAAPDPEAIELPLSTENGVPWVAAQLAG